MKKYSAVLLFTFMSSIAFSQSTFTGAVGLNNLGNLSYIPNECSVYENENEMFFYRHVPFDQIDGDVVFYEDMKNHKLQYDEFGFPFYDFPINEMCVLYGGRRFIYIDNFYNVENYSFNFSDFYKSNSYSYPCVNEVTCIWSKEMVSQMLNECEPLFHKINNGVSLSCTSNLKDSKNIYTIKNIESNFISDSNNKNYLWNSTLVPWVEAEEGDGSGVSIDIKFIPNEFSDEESFKRGMCNAFVIMNGYVDFFRRDLFKKNNRVKTLLVESCDELEPFSFTVVLKDTPDFQQIDLPRYAKKIKITIVDVYKGTHYNDTCLSGIFTVGKNYCDNNASREDVENLIYDSEYFMEWSKWKNVLFDFSREPHH